MMKKNTIILSAVVVVVLIVIVGLLIVLGGGKYGSPERTLSTMIKAMKKGDVEAYLDCLTESSRELMVQDGVAQIKEEDLKGGTEDLENLKFELVEKSGDIAVLKEEEEGGTLVFKKEKGGWKFDIEETYKKMFENMQIDLGEETGE